MSAHAPITTLAEYDAVDLDECAEGYREGWHDPDEPGGNRSRSYWHGWRCAQFDRGRLEIPESHRILVRDVVRRDKQRAAVSA